MQVTLSAIAVRARVSKATVSLALHGHPRISQATRERVAAIAQELGYYRQMLVSECMAAVRSGRSVTATQTVIFLVPDASEAGLSSVLPIYKGARHRARGRGWEIKLVKFGHKVDRAAPAAGYSPRPTDSVIIAPCGENPPASDLVDNRAASVVVEGAPPLVDLHRVSCDYLADTRDAVRRLAELGYRRPGFVTSPFNLARTDGTTLASFCAARLQFGDLGLVPPLIVPSKADFATIAGWLSRERPDVVIAEDWSAVRAAAGQAGLRIPEDFGYIGIGADSPEKRCSCFRRPHAAMGAAALDLVAAQVIRRENNFFNHPRLVLLPGDWQAGATLPPRRR